MQRLAAAAALVRIAPKQDDVVAILRTLTNFSWPVRAGSWALNPTSGTDRVRLPARVALWRLGVEREPPVEEIIRQNEQNDSEVVQQLGDIGPAAAAALPYLKSLVEFYRGPTQISAAIAIRKIAPLEAARLGLPGVLVLPDPP